MFNKTAWVVVTALLLGLNSFALAKPAPAVEKKPDGAQFEVPGGLLRIQFLTDSIVRVAFSKDKKFFTRQTITRVDVPPFLSGWDLKSTSTGWSLSTARLTVSVDSAKGSVRFLDPQGKPLLSETEGGRSLEPAMVQGEKTFHVHQSWEPNSDEGLYGLGERQLGILNLKGYDLDLWQHNTSAVIPFLVSNQGYGIFWDNSSFTRFGDLRSFESIPAEHLVDKSGKRGGLTVQAFKASGPVSQTSVLTVDFKPKVSGDRFPDTRWEGSLAVTQTADYQFLCRSNGGIQVWMDGKLIMSHWRQGWLTDNDQVKVRLEAGHSYPLKIEWDTEQGTTMDFRWKTPGTDPSTSLWSEVGDGVDYTFVYGPSLDQVVAGYRTLTGKAPLMPSWAFGLWQSRQRYKTSQESLDVVKTFRDKKIPFDNIVQDWMYWKEDSWGSHKFDPERFPDPDGWLKALHELNAHVMISVWGKFYPGTDNFQQMLDHGYLHQQILKEGLKDWINYRYTFYDPFNDGARKLFWDQINTRLFSKGIDAWWMDATEPDVTPSPPTLEDLRSHTNPTALGTASRMILGYPLMNSRGIYEGQRKTSPDQRVFILTRCGYAGQQRYAAAVWSGDITSTWAVLAKQIPAGLNFSLSGMPYWATDTGGYTMQDKFSADKPTSADLEEWRELNARWFEYSTFTPLLRVHGELKNREMWELGGESSPAYKAELKFDRLRYRMFPYVYSTAAEVTKHDASFLRALVMDFPREPKVADLTDEYLFGKAFLVAPITEYRARSREVYLPSDALWYDFWSGRSMAGGTQQAPSPYDAMPLFVRSGSILPFGPEQQYVSEKPQDPITLYVYAGADGDFNFYEDDGLTYDYEKGASAEIPLHWDDTSGTLTLGKREGSFKGMLSERTFQVVLVSKDHPVGFSFELNPENKVSYRGEAVSLKLKN